MTVPFRETPEFLRGRRAEALVESRLKSFGWFILPACDYSGPLSDRAPKIQGAETAIVLPDLFIAKQGLARWAEVKSKWKPCRYRMTGKDYHGISLRLWRHYFRCQEESGIHVWLFIVEESTQVLLYQSIDELAKEVSPYYGDKVDPGGMIYWPRDRFTALDLNAIPGLLDPIPFT